MVSIRKLLINVVITQQAKEADRLEPKGTVAGSRGFEISSHGHSTLPANRENLNRELSFVRNMVSLYVSCKGKLRVSKAHRRAGKGDRRKRMPLCNAADTR